jgi:hypothetical protein
MNILGAVPSQMDEQDLNLGDSETMWQPCEQEQTWRTAVLPPALRSLRERGSRGGEYQPAGAKADPPVFFIRTFDLVNDENIDLYLATLGAIPLTTYMGYC